LRWQTSKSPPRHSFEPRLRFSVQDDSSIPAARYEDPHLGGDRVSGLAIVASVCRAWGSTPMPSGTTVWAVLGPENQL
jgi:hypothetical protein